MVIIIITVAESWRGAIRFRVWCVAVWWSQPASFTWSSFVWSLPHSVLHVFRQDSSSCFCLIWLRLRS